MKVLLSFVRIIVVVTLFAGAWVMTVPRSVFAASFVVTKLADTNDGVCDSDCSLREAVIAANASAGADTITFAISGTFTLSIAGAAEDVAASGDLDITDDVTITGNGAANTLIDGGAIDRVFDIHNLGGSANRIVEFAGVTVQNGYESTGGAGYGGGIAVRADRNTSADSTRVTVRNSIIRNNRTATAIGGGLYALKNVSGGIPELTIQNSTISGNTAGATTGNIGGGIYCSNCTLTVENSTVSGNTANGLTGGAGILLAGSSATITTITNTTISGNQTTSASANSAGGISIPAGTSTLNMQHVTIANNTANAGAGGLNNATGTVNATNTLITNNSGAIANVGGALGINGTNITNIVIDISGVAALADNGGPTLTHALTAGSPAIDAGTNTPTADQRGATRPTDGDGNGTATNDVGAFELGGLQCGIQAAGEPATYTFLGNVSAGITSDGANLDCLRVTDIPWNHPNAINGGTGLGTKTGKHWIINGLQSDHSTASTADYMLNLTLPHTITPDTNASVCKYPGSQGGFGWDCSRTGSTASTVWLDGITSLSEWTVGDRVGPTALTLRDLIATTPASPSVIGALSAMLATLGALLIGRRLKAKSQS